MKREIGSRVLANGHSICELGKNPDVTADLTATLPPGYRPSNRKEVEAYRARLAAELRIVDLLLEEATDDSTYQLIVPEPAAGLIDDGSDNSQWVTLDQIAASVRMAKHSMRRYMTKKAEKPMPKADRPGKGRREAYWLWPNVRDWCASTFHMPNLPKRFPALKR
jgi:hypothetical protein